MSKGMYGPLVVRGLTIGGDSNDATVRAPTSADDSSAQLNTGVCVETDDARRYRYVKANEAIEIGMVVTPLQPDVTITNATAAASDNTITKTSAFTASRYNDDHEDWYVALNGGTGPGQVRKIVSNTVSVLTLDTAWTTAISTDTDGVTFSPYHVEQADAADERVSGVAISAITSAQYAWVQDRGFCPMVRCVGSTDAAAAHEGLVSSSTSGVAKGLTAGGTTADEADKAFGYAYYAYTSADAAGQGVAAYLMAG